MQRLALNLQMMKNGLIHLGEREEIEQAYKISTDSLKMATEQISVE